MRMNAETDLYQHLLRLRQPYNCEPFSTGCVRKITVVTDERSTPRAVLAPDQGSSKLERVGRSKFVNTK